jgi:RHH-type proline utilization regulon transcriptional repressor/proline dehydrogenase/delta 1-pyrroline-5-carboxylate dehydrogenase
MVIIPDLSQYFRKKESAIAVWKGKTLNNRRQAMHARLRELTLKDEGQCVAALKGALGLSPQERADIQARAIALVNAIRERGDSGLMEKFLAQYGLNSDEGVALMCLAEAYLRTPDAATLDALISDKIGGGDWARHLGRAESALVNASTWALMLTGKVFRTIPAQADDLAHVMRSVVRRLGEPVARSAVGEAMKLMGRQFVLGRDITEAMANSRPWAQKGYLFSYDMLGEAARTARDADRYFAAYANAILAIGREAREDDPHRNGGISVKLSALHPRYEWNKRERVLAELAPRLGELARMAKSANIPLAIDAEEADRLELSLDVIAEVARMPALGGWEGFGVVVQAYSRRAPAVLDFVIDLARRTRRRMSVRLVKGAYWDAEVKQAQVMGMAGYPVFTRKETTDLSYLACARMLLEASREGRIHPQFATHNAHTVTAIVHMARAMGAQAIEFQRLHGMGEALHDISMARDGFARRIYAPVGVHKDLLAYLVRRLLENGANSSFVHQVLDRSVGAERIAADPVLAMERADPLPHPAIPLPADLFAPQRRNSQGGNLNDPAFAAALEDRVAPFLATRWGAGKGREIRNPANRDDLVGHVIDSSESDAKAAIGRALAAFGEWSGKPPVERAMVLEKAADLYEEHGGELMALAMREAGKNRADALAELREAVDFLRYYAQIARDKGAQAEALGAVVCISPWNFPLAIFIGQIAGALAAGNTVIAKPAEQTPLIAARAVQLIAEAGLPAGALELVQGDGAKVGPALTGDPRVAGVAFTGGTDTARLIDISMARDGNPDAPLIAETGGLNAMIVDSTALPEQAVRDILASAFQSAGQRCSALRVLHVQKDVAPQILEMLEGAARELTIGDPWRADTDIGPLIDAAALETVEEHCRRLTGEGRLLLRLDLPEGSAKGSFCAPAVFRLDSILQLEREVFGPVLHVVEFEADRIDAVVDDINATGYGLTLGVHSRIDTRVDRIIARARIGNIYVNRNQIGAVVGVQPFGGEGLSGTGPKAGGPHYPWRFARHATPRPVARGPETLTGPTGERNSLSMRPRGIVACLGPGEAAAQRQRRAAQAAGNRVLTGDMEALREAVEADRVDAVMIDGPAPRELRTLLAQKQGRRVPVIGEHAGLFMLHSEASVSEDTTASGGNASLLSSAA